MAAPGSSTTTSQTTTSARRTPAFAPKERKPARRRLSLRRAGPAPVVALLIPALRSRPFSVEVPAGVTVYELDPEHGVRIFRQGGPFWDPAGIPQRRWLWVFSTEGAANDLQRPLREVPALADVQHEHVAFYRSREKVPAGRHPLELQVCRKYLFGLLERAVAEELDRRFPRPEVTDGDPSGPRSTGASST